ncbi:MAG: MBL fold metallo-hydrolase [Acidimicrobiales bacterium]|nr:MBL fold metallo-hydrolase [Acidimicrobiales bacterium]
MAAAWPVDVQQLTAAVRVLPGADVGRYPSGNSVLVTGAAETVIIDPSVTVVEHGGALPIDAVVNSHGHEDHVAGNGLYPNARVHIHHDDLLAAHSLDGLLDIYGLEGDTRAAFGAELVEHFHYTPRPDATGFGDGHVFDLGGGTRLEAVHLPGHTRGHSGFRITGGVFFLSDIDLTGFGPYYGDVWSDLEDFEASLVQVREEDADFYVTFHHKGIIEGRNDFLALLDAFHAVIGRRHDAMLEFLAEPRSVADMVARRFIYRPHVQHTFADSVEKRSAELHLQRMLTRGEAEATDDGRFVRS